MKASNQCKTVSIFENQKTNEVVVVMVVNIQLKEGARNHRKGRKYRELFCEPRDNFYRKAQISQNCP